jgi:hypothetical protein
MNYTELSTFVNEQIEFHRAKATEYTKSYPKRAERHTQTALHFSELAEWIKDAATTVESVDSLKKKIAELESSVANADGAKKAPGKQSQLALSFEDIEGLPDELLQELGFSDGDKMDFTIHRTINELGGVTSIDRLLVTIYKETGEIIKRSNVNQRLYRMAQRGALFPVPGKKGVYSTEEITEEDASKLR